MVFAGGFEKLDAVLTGYVVIGDSAVDLLLAKTRRPIVGGCRCVDLESVIFGFQERRGYIDEIRLIIDVEDTNRIPDSTRICRSRTSISDCEGECGIRSTISQQMQFIAYLVP